MKMKSLLCGVLVLCGVFFVLTPIDLDARTQVDETARLLAGKNVASVSGLAAHARTPFYVRYARQLTSAWMRFRQSQMEPLQAWWRHWRPATYATVLYPFGGPDLVNALALFPQADTYLLFGLEPPGAIPDPAGMTRGAIEAGLTGLKASLETFFRMNHFFTREMGRRLGRESFSSVTGLMLFFLAINDCEVLRAARIALGPGAKIVPGNAADDAIDPLQPPRDRVPGVEIAFRRQGGTIRVVRYFMLDVSDAALAKRSPGFIPYLKTYGRCATLVKSASYLMHRDGTREEAPHFETIRTFLLAQSDFIVQDDSGIPLRFFPRDRWKLRFHGKYGVPVAEFAHRRQRDLWNEMCYNSTGTLPFSFGYDQRPGAANIMTAERIR